MPWKRTLGVYACAVLPLLATSLLLGWADVRYWVFAALLCTVILPWMQRQMLKGATPIPPPPGARPHTHYFRGESSRGAITMQSPWRDLVIVGPSFEAADDATKRAVLTHEHVHLDGFHATLSFGIILALIRLFNDGLLDDAGPLFAVLGLALVAWELLRHSLRGDVRSLGPFVGLLGIGYALVYVSGIFNAPAGQDLQTYVDDHIRVWSPYVFGAIGLFGPVLIVQALLMETWADLKAARREDMHLALDWLNGPGGDRPVRLIDIGLTNALTSHPTERFRRWLASRA